MGTGRRPPSSHEPDMESGHRRARERPPPPSHMYPPPPEPWFSWLVPLIFVANISIFIATMYVNDCPFYTGPQNCLLYDPLGRFSFQPFDENSLIGPSVVTLKELGALERELVEQDKEFWRLFSCIWLHAGVIHLATNMISLLLIGVRLEQEFGFLKIGALYVLSGFGGSMMSTLTFSGPEKTVSVGASGALFGLLGSMLSELITNWTTYVNKCAALISLIVIIGLNLAIGLLPHVDNSAHIGGFISGFLLGFILLIRPQYGYVSRRYAPSGYAIKHKKSKYTCYQHFFWVTALIILIIGYVFGLDMMLKGETIQSKPLQKLH